MAKIIDGRKCPPKGYLIFGRCYSGLTTRYRWRCRYKDGSVTTSREHESYDDAVMEAWEDHMMEAFSTEPEQARQGKD